MHPSAFAAKHNAATLTAAATGLCVDITVRHRLGVSKTSVRLTAWHVLLWGFCICYVVPPAFCACVSPRCPGGSLVGMLSSVAELKGVDFSKWWVFWVDERNVPHSSPDSNYKGAQDALLGRVGIPAAQVSDAANGGWHPACGVWLQVNDDLVTSKWQCWQSYTAGGMPVCHARADWRGAAARRLWPGGLLVFTRHCSTAISVT